METKKATGFSFDDMFGDAQEFVPNPADVAEGEFESLDEEGDVSEDELVEMECDDIEPAADEAVDIDDVDSYGEPEDEEEADDMLDDLLSDDSDEGLSDEESLVASK